MPDKGKTTTLNFVWDLLVLNGGISTNRQVIGNPIQNDFSDIVFRGTQQIAFFTMGDYSNDLAKAIYDYDRQNVDVLVCALSTNNAKINANKALNRFNTTRLNKSVALNKIYESALNTTDAQNIFNQI